MKEPKTIQFLKEIPAWVVILPIIFLFVWLNFYSDRPIWERLLENSLTALYAFLRGVNYGQQTANIGGDAVINPQPVEQPTDLQNLQPEEIAGAVENIKEEGN